MSKLGYDGLLVERDIEIFELEQKIQDLNLRVKELTRYQGMYFQKIKEIDKIKKMIKENYEMLPDQVKYNFKELLEELFGTRYN